MEKIWVFYPNFRRKIETALKEKFEADSGFDEDDYKDLVGRTAAEYRDDKDIGYKSRGDGRLDWPVWLERARDGFGDHWDDVKGINPDTINNLNPHIPDGLTELI